jgi:hypothetical protein
MQAATDHHLENFLECKEALERLLETVNDPSEQWMLGLFKVQGEGLQGKFITWRFPNKQFEEAAQHLMEQQR